jgi:hypothetical protein
MSEYLNVGFLDPYDELIEIEVLGKVFEVPENNLLLRQLQAVAPEIGSGKYCWNAECRYCEVSYRRESDGAELSGLACRLKGFPNMRITKIAPEMRYNLGRALALAKPVRS